MDTHVGCTLSFVVHSTPTNGHTRRMYTIICCTQHAYTQTHMDHVYDHCTQHACTPTHTHALCTHGHMRTMYTIICCTQHAYTWRVGDTHMMYTT